MQRERTVLAWERTGLMFLVVGALLLRAGGPPYPEPGHVPGAIGILVGGVLVAGAMRAGGLRGAGGRRLRRALVRLVGVAAVGLSLAALAVMLLPR